MIIHLIAAARPNFMKIAPLYHALKKELWAKPVIVHTGQHYDLNMSDVFFQDLHLPAPDIHLGVGSGTHAEQTGQVMIAYEKVLVKEQPDLVIVVGDVNSTVACALATTKLSFSSHYPPSAINYELGQRPLVGHLEAGLRSNDRTMPEEINRLVTDSIADILWTPSPDGDENLLREGVLPEKICCVGNIMIDSLEMLRDRIQNEEGCCGHGFASGHYGVVTLHRPSNVDDPKALKRLGRTLVKLSDQLPMVFPVHPRTRKNIDKAGLSDELSAAVNFKLIEPLSYRKFMNLVFNCRLVITDSGGIQEETSYLGIPCLTLRPNTERPVTITQGTNKLCSVADLAENVRKILAGAARIPCRIDLWDGHTSDRVVRSIRNIFKI
jgi:UDP-N-acetylglucosamine 2-epimerase (non-hydrolysing)